MSIIIRNIISGTEFRGEELEYLIDDDTAIGEVFLDGDLIYQYCDAPVANEDQLAFLFSIEHEIRYIDSEWELTDEFNDDSY